MRPEPRCRSRRHRAANKKPSISRTHPRRLPARRPRQVQGSRGPVHPQRRTAPPPVSLNPRSIPSHLPNRLGIQGATPSLHAIPAVRNPLPDNLKRLRRGGAQRGQKTVAEGEPGPRDRRTQPEAARLGAEEWRVTPPPQ